MQVAFLAASRWHLLPWISMQPLFWPLRDRAFHLSPFFFVASQFPLKKIFQIQTFSSVPVAKVYFFFPIRICCFLFQGTLDMSVAFDHSATQIKAKEGKGSHELRFRLDPDSSLLIWTMERSYNCCQIGMTYCNRERSLFTKVRGKSSRIKLREVEKRNRKMVLPTPTLSQHSIGLGNEISIWGLASPGTECIADAASFKEEWPIC